MAETLTACPNFSGIVWEVSGCRVFCGARACSQSNPPALPAFRALCSFEVPENFALQNSLLYSAPHGRPKNALDASLRCESRIPAVSAVVMTAVALTYYKSQLILTIMWGIRYGLDCLGVTRQYSLIDGQCFILIVQVLVNTQD